MNLNEFERILIQRAKAFQVIARMETVMGGHNKNRPMKESIKKIKGRVFHLPLPIENTLEKLPNPTDAIVQDQELLVLMRGVPNKSNKIWQSCVDVKKVYDALIWLKSNNPLYKEINLPHHVEELHDFINVEFNSYVDDNAANEDVAEQIQVDENVENQIQVNVDDEQEIIVEPAKKMITQKDETDDFYENMTIYPVVEKRLNVEPTKIYQFLKVIDDNIDNREAKLDLMCFPNLYCYGVNGQNQEREQKLQPGEYAKLLMRSTDRRFRTDAQFLFYLLNQASIRQLSAGIFHKLNVTNDTKALNVQSFMDLIKSNKLEHLSTIFGRLRGSQQFFKKAQNDVNCMVAHYGPATFFLTLSPSEYHWTDLHEFYKTLYKDEKPRSLNSYIATDPAIASIFIELKFKAMMAFLLSDSHPLGVIVHFFWRREYQSRGLQHFHIMLWVKNAPIIGKPNDAEIADFITKYISCVIPDKNNFPTLYQRVTKYQSHCHNSYCQRRKKTNKKGSSVSVCRFGFGR